MGEYISLQLLMLVALVHFNPVSSHTHVSPKSKHQIMEEFNHWDNMVKSISKDATNSLLNNIGNIAPFLAATDEFVSLLTSFSPNEEKEEVISMKERFDQVNKDFEEATAAVDNMEELLNVSNSQHETFVKSVKEINQAFKMLYNFLDDLEHIRCHNMTDCTRIRSNITKHYQRFFDVGSALQSILSQSVNEQGPSQNRSLIRDIKIHYACDLNKVNLFANGVIKLSLKAQMTILAYESFNNAQHDGVLVLLKNLLAWIYKVRKTSDEVKNECLKDIKTYMLRDIDAKIFQEKDDDVLRSFMKRKYNWLDWNLYSCITNDPGEHYQINVYGDFWTSHHTVGNASKNIAAVFVDKEGTYDDQQEWVSNTIDEISSTAICGLGCICDMKMIGDLIQSELEKRDMWSYILSLNILSASTDVSILADNPLTYIRKYVTFKAKTITGEKKGESVEDMTVQVLVTFKSLEMASIQSRDDVCNGHGHNLRLPYSSQTLCQCRLSFDGRYCQRFSRIAIAYTINDLIYRTIQLPKLAQIYNGEIMDLQRDLKIDFRQIDLIIENIGRIISKSYESFESAMSHPFAWNKLDAKYSQAVSQINYWTSLFRNLPLHDKERRVLAKAVLQKEGVREWLEDLHELFIGRKFDLKPFMIAFIDDRFDQKNGCNAQYKTDVDDVLRQFYILQQKGYLIWAQSLNILGLDATVVRRTYAARLLSQNSMFMASTCEYSIANSLNVECNGGRYINSHTILTTRCRENYFVSGQTSTTCAEAKSSCLQCKCSVDGSVGKECADLSGQCSCKNMFYGQKCTNRDCLWSSWSGFSRCSKNCDYGGTKYRTRTHQVTKVGKGKECVGESRLTENCFQGCCSTQYHCSATKNCIPSAKKCDYVNDCGDSMDEKSCQESCEYRYTPWNDDGRGNLYYLDRHSLDCGGSQYVLQWFHLESAGRRIRYKYRCCRLNQNIAQNRNVNNAASFGGRGDCRYLDRQQVRCAPHEYLNQFQLLRSGPVNVFFRYRCAKLTSTKLRQHQRCVAFSTTASFDGNGNNHYLDRQVIGCSGRSFLNTFYLRRTSNNWWHYTYNCCSIVP